MSILGNAVVRREDPGFLTGSATYVDDLLPADALYLAYVRSPYAHARITGVEVDEAVAAPGVAGVFTGADVAEMGLAPNVLPMFPDAMRRPYVAADVVRYQGQPVVAVVVETQAQAVDATELVIVDYEPLAPVTDPEAAVRDEVLIFGDHGTNILNHMESPAAADFSECEVVVSERIVNQRLTAAPIEGRTGMTQRMITGTYELGNVGFSADVVVTNTVPITAYRGAGRPEAAVAIERMVDRFAAEIGMDPAEVRSRNLMPKFTEPYVTAMGPSYDVGDYPEALRRALEAVGYDELRAAQCERRERGDTPLLGIGIAQGVA